jgi:hypothetical protein
MLELIPLIGPQLSLIGTLIGSLLILKGGFYRLISTPPPSIAVRLVWVSTILPGALMLALSF